MDNKKCSTGVAVFGWLMIIINAFLLLAALNIKGFFEAYKFLHKNFVIALYTYSIISAVTAIVAGIGILKLKEILRKIGVFINSLDVLQGIPLFFFTVKGLKEYFYTETISAMPPEVPQSATTMVANISFYFTVILIWGLIGLSILFIYFFTRPKVKEQFK